MRFLSDVSSDLRFTFRMLRHHLSFSFVAVLSLALGIGASSAIFSLIYALYVDPYPYRDSDRFLNLTFVNEQGRSGTINYSLADYLELERTAKTLEDVTARDERTAVITSGIPESVRTVQFSPNAFEFLGVPAMLGRTWVRGDIAQPATPPRVAVLSYLFWTRYFNGDRNIIGKTVEVDRQPYTILGVVPPRFTWNDGDIYMPLAITPDPKHFVPVMTHVKKGIGLAAVNAELQSITERFRQRAPNNYPKQFRMAVETLNQYLLSNFGRTLKVLIAAVFLLLIIGCANVSILLLARATARQKEVAIRVSIGARTVRILEQLLTESVVIALSGGLLGIVLAYWGVPAIVRLMPEYSVPHEAVIHVNGWVVAFTFLISVLTGILFGMTPALQLAATDVNSAMQDASRGSSAGNRGGNIRNVLIVGEVALTIILLVGASVAVRSFAALHRAPLGYRPENVLAMNVNLPEGRYASWETRNALYERLTAKVRSLPGVRSAAFTETALPPYIGFNASFEIAGLPKRDPQRVHIGLIGSQYFNTVGISLVEGRFLSEAEILRNAHLGVINQELVRRYFPAGHNPIGARIHLPELKIDQAGVFLPPVGDEWFEVVGVASDARNRGLQDPAEPAIYVPYEMATVPGGVLLLKTSVAPQSVARAAREAVRSVDADIPVTQVRTLDEYLDMFERAYPRFSTILFSVFATVGLLLAATGLYSIVSYSVARRTQEFGIRMALGARPSNVLLLVFRSIAVLMGAGSLIGLLSSFALSGLIAQYVNGWNPRDPIAYVAVTLVLVLTGLFACWIPARRATGIQPLRALRHE